MVCGNAGGNWAARQNLGHHFVLARHAAVLAELVDCVVGRRNRVAGGVEAPASGAASRRVALLVDRLVVVARLVNQAVVVRVLHNKQRVTAVAAAGTYFHQFAIAYGPSGTQQSTEAGVEIDCAKKKPSALFFFSLDFDLK